MRTVSFTIPRTLPGTNKLLRMPHWTRTKQAKALAFEMHILTLGQRPEKPFRKARVTIERHSLGKLDRDNLFGSAKFLLDILQPQSDRHPHGLGVIADDAPDVCELDVTNARAVSQADQRTVVRVEEVL